MRNRNEWGGGNIKGKRKKERDKNLDVNIDHVLIKRIIGLQIKFRVLKRDTNIVDKNISLQMSDLVLQNLGVVLRVDREIDRDNLGLNIFGTALLSNSIELALGPAHQTDVVSLLGELKTELFSNPVGGTGHDSPVALPDLHLLLSINGHEGQKTNKLDDEDDQKGQPHAFQEAGAENGVQQVEHVWLCEKRKRKKTRVGK